MTEAKSEWVKLKPAELEKLVIELHKQGESPAKIGLILRDKHGVPKAKLISKKITHIIRDAKLTVVSEKEQVEGKMQKLGKHIEKNKHDYTAKRSLNKKQWILHRLSQ